jgi:glutathione S-transferase
VANTFSAADIQLSFVLDAGAARGPLKAYANLVRLEQRLKTRAAYQRALQRGGPYELAP